MSDYTGPGIYFFESVATKTVVNLTGSNSANGTKVIGYQKSNTANERWQVAHAGQDQYFLINASTGTYLTAPASTSDQGITGNIIAPTSARPKWKIVAAKNGKGGYVFHSVAHPGYVLNLKGSSAENSTECIVWQDTPGASNQEWLIKLP